MAPEGMVVPRSDPATLVITRPAPKGVAFAEAVRAVLPDIQVVLSPAFDFEEVRSVVPPFEEAIFTSEVGVVHAPDGEGRVAWCVGAATAQAAIGRGYDARSADGDAEDLIGMILAARPSGSMLHIRGEKSRGDIAERLRAEGLNCDEVVRYRKAPLPLPDAVEAATGKDAGRVLFPVFSAETVSILADWALDFGSAEIAAISPAVAEAAKALSPARIETSEAPNQAAMVDLVVRMIA